MNYVSAQHNNHHHLLSKNTHTHKTFTPVWSANCSPRFIPWSAVTVCRFLVRRWGPKVRILYHVDWLSVKSLGVLLHHRRLPSQNTGCYVYWLNDWRRVLRLEVAQFGWYRLVNYVVTIAIFSCMNRKKFNTNKHYTVCVTQVFAIILSSYMRKNLLVSTIQKRGRWKCWTWKCRTWNKRTE